MGKPSVAAPLEKSATPSHPVSAIPAPLALYRAARTMPHGMPTLSRDTHQRRWLPQCKAVTQTRHSRSGSPRHTSTPEGSLQPAAFWCPAAAAAEEAGAFTEAELVETGAYSSNSAMPQRCAILVHGSDHREITQGGHACTVHTRTTRTHKEVASSGTVQHQTTTGQARRPKRSNVLRLHKCARTWCPHKIPQLS